MSYRFKVGIAGKDVTRLALMRWLEQNVGPLTSADLSGVTFRGVNWDIQADVHQDFGFWMLHDNTTQDIPETTQRYTVTIDDETAAVMFKLSWPRAIELN